MSLWDEFTETVGDVVDAVGDAVETVVETVVDPVKDAVDSFIDAVRDFFRDAARWIRKNLGKALGDVFDFVFGVIDGILEGGKTLIDDLFAIVKTIGKMAADTIRLDLPAVIRDFGDLVSEFVDLAKDVVRVFLGGSIVGGIRGYYQRESLRSFVESLIDSRFGDNPSRRDRIRNRVGLADGKVALALKASHQILFLDSRDTPLFEWHASGFIDLYALAGVATFGSLIVQKPRSYARVVDSSGRDTLWPPVNHHVLSSYLESRGASHRLRFYAMEQDVAASHMAVAKSKCERLGLLIEWNNATRFSLFNKYAVLQIRTQEEYNSQDSRWERDLVLRGLRSATSGDDGNVFAMGAFRVFDETMESTFGITLGRCITEHGDRFVASSNESVCTCTSAFQKAERTDFLCSIVRRKNSALLDIGSGVLYRDYWPYLAFKYVLAHEIGHYVGLGHPTHDGLQNVMFQMKANSMLDWGLFNYYLDSEPEFTLEDAKNCWRFLVDQMPHVLE